MNSSALSRHRCIVIHVPLSRFLKLRRIIAVRLVYNWEVGTLITTQMGHWNLGYKTSRSAPTYVPKERRTPLLKYALQKKSLTFNMVNITDNSKFSFNYFIGPLLDDYAPSNGLGMHELKALSIVYVQV